jgi:hypothetical protein
MVPLDNGGNLQVAVLDFRLQTAGRAFTTSLLNWPPFVAEPACAQALKETPRSLVSALHQLASASISGWAV